MEPPKSPKRPPSPLRELEGKGYQIIDRSVFVEEEGFKWYSSRKFYPVRIGQAFKNNRYQVLSKIGFGASATLWLCRDVVRHQYVYLKVSVEHDPHSEKEIRAMEHIASVLPVKDTNKGIRRLRHRFRICSDEGTFSGIILDPLCTTLGEFRQANGGRLDIMKVKEIAVSLLESMDLLHRVANVIHTDIQEDAIMLSVKENDDLRKAEEEEMREPSARKIDGGRTIYQSRLMNIDTGRPVIADFGSARFGRTSYVGNTPAGLNRTPEVLFGLKWDHKVDIWSFGLLLWVLLEGEHLFKSPGSSARTQLPVSLIAKMVGLLGPPPRDMWEFSHAAKDLFNLDGSLRGGTKVKPSSLEKEEGCLRDEEKQEFLRFLRRTLQWRPENRPTARELLKDPWLEELR